MKDIRKKTQINGKCRYACSIVVPYIGSWLILEGICAILNIFVSYIYEILHLSLNYKKQLHISVTRGASQYEKQ